MDIRDAEIGSARWSLRASVWAAVTSGFAHVLRLLSHTMVFGRALGLGRRKATRMAATNGKEDIHAMGIPANGLAAITQSVEQNKSSHDAPADSDAHSALREHYEAQLREAKLALEVKEWEQRLIEERENRELMVTLMTQGGLGLQLLASLRSGHATTLELAATVAVQPDLVATTLARLLLFGAVELHDEVSFACAAKGLGVLSCIEATTGVSLQPELTTIAG